MSATPKKTKDRHSKRQQLQILWSNRYFWRRKSVIWKIFAIRQRRKCRADLSWVLRLDWVFPLTRDENLSERVCRSCGRKIRNAAELHSFIEQVLCSKRVDEDLNCKDSEDRCKRQLPNTITPERSNTKKQTASTVRDICTFAVLCSDSHDLFVASLVFMKIYEGHFMLCYKEECYALANFKRS